MNDVQDVMDLFKSYEDKTFIQLKHCNYREAVAQFLAKNSVLVEKEEIIEGEKTSYIDRYGVFKYKNSIKINRLQLKCQISCFHQKDWEFQFDSFLPPHQPIANERILETSEKTVIVSYLNEEKQTQLYAVPVSIAETLDLEEFHQKKMDVSHAKQVLTALIPYRIASMIYLQE